MSWETRFGSPCELSFWPSALPVLPKNSSTRPTTIPRTPLPCTGTPVSIHAAPLVRQQRERERMSRLHQSRPQRHGTWLLSLQQLHFWEEWQRRVLVLRRPPCGRRCALSILHGLARPRPSPLIGGISPCSVGFVQSRQSRYERQRRAVSLVTVSCFKRRLQSSGVYSHSQLLLPQRRACCEHLSTPCRGCAARPSSCSFRSPFVGRSTAPPLTACAGTAHLSDGACLLGKHSLRVTGAQRLATLGVEVGKLWSWPDALEGPF